MGDLYGGFVWGICMGDLYGELYGECGPSKDFSAPPRFPHTIVWGNRSCSVEVRKYHWEMRESPRTTKLPCVSSRISIGITVVLSARGGRGVQGAGVVEKSEGVERFAIGEAGVIN